MEEPTSKVGSKRFQPIFVKPDTRSKLNELREKSGMLAYRIVDEALALFEAEKGLGS
ncbi:MAG: hypothetical protein K0S79_69 [Nitrospira sp.]|jgi:hypothetical protein|nr:hypothetical protein [Nitrospira sp.]